MTAAADLAIAVFAAEYALAAAGTVLSGGGVDVDDAAGQAFSDTAREGGKLWLDANPGHFMAPQVSAWLGPEGIEP